MPSPDTLADVLAIIKKEELIGLLPSLLKYIIDNGINNLKLEDNPIFQDEDIVIEDIYNFGKKEIIKTGYHKITGRVDEDLINYNTVNVVSTRYGIALDLERIPKKITK